MGELRRYGSRAGVVNLTHLEGGIRSRLGRPCMAVCTLSTWTMSRRHASTLFVAPFADALAKALADALAKALADARLKGAVLFSTLRLARLALVPATMPRPVRGLAIVPSMVPVVPMVSVAPVVPKRWSEFSLAPMLVPMSVPMLVPNFVARGGS